MENAVRAAARRGRKSNVRANESVQAGPRGKRDGGERDDEPRPPSNRAGHAAARSLRSALVIRRIAFLDAVLEVTDGAADPLSESGEPIGAENHDHDCQNDE